MMPTLECWSQVLGRPLERGRGGCEIRNKQLNSVLLVVKSRFNWEDVNSDWLGPLLLVYGQQVAARFSPEVVFAVRCACLQVLTAHFSSGTLKPSHPTVKNLPRKQLISAGGGPVSDTCSRQTRSTGRIATTVDIKNDKCRAAWFESHNWSCASVKLI